MLKKLAMSIVILGLAAPGCEKTTVKGPEGKKLTLVKPMDTTIERGETRKVSISIARENYSGPVTVKFEGLPAGVTVADGGRQIEGNERTFALVASNNADLVSNHAAEVTISGPDGISATEVFHVTVREKKA